MKKILFIIGSLRKESFNKKLAEEVEQMLTDAQKENLRLQVDAFLEYIG